MTHIGQLGDGVGLGEVIPGRGLQTTPTPGKPTLYALRPPMLVKNVGGILFRDSGHILSAVGGGSMTSMFSAMADAVSRFCYNAHASPPHGCSV